MEFEPAAFRSGHRSASSASWSWQCCLSALSQLLCSLLRGSGGFRSRVRTRARPQGDGWQPSVAATTCQPVWRDADHFCFITLDDPILSVWTVGDGIWSGFGIGSLLGTVGSWFSPGQGFVYSLSYVVLIYFFCYFWTAISFNPKDMAENLKDSGSFIPGIGPASGLRFILSR